MFTVQLLLNFEYTAECSSVGVSGNDDIWVYVNSHLVVNLGGTGQGQQTVDLAATGAGLQAGGKYSMNVFLANRLGTASNAVSKFAFTSNCETLTSWVPPNAKCPSPTGPPDTSTPTASPADSGNTLTAARPTAAPAAVPAPGEAPTATGQPSGTAAPGATPAPTPTSQDRNLTTSGPTAAPVEAPTQQPAGTPTATAAPAATPTLRPSAATAAPGVTPAPTPTSRPSTAAPGAPTASAPCRRERPGLAIATWCNRPSTTTLPIATTPDLVVEAPSERAISYNRDNLRALRRGILRDRCSSDAYALRFTGWFQATSNGTYTIVLQAGGSSAILMFDGSQQLLLRGEPLPTTLLCQGQEVVTSMQQMFAAGCKVSQESQKRWSRSSFSNGGIKTCLN